MAQIEELDERWNGILDAIENGEAKCIGVGEWVKGSRYEVWNLGTTFVALIKEQLSSSCVWMETIKVEDINNFIEENYE